jgi:hypothetical protein
MSFVRKLRLKLIHQTDPSCDVAASIDRLGELIDKSKCKAANSLPSVERSIEVIDNAVALNRKLSEQVSIS